MDLFTKLNKNVESLAVMFEEQMGEYDQKLQQATSASPSAAAPGPVQSPNLPTLACEFAQFKSLIWKTLSLLRNQIDLLVLGVDRHETASRRKVLLFHGVAENNNEDTSALVKHIITDQMQLPQSLCDDISVCHRLGAKKDDKTRPVMVRFLSYRQRDEVWKGKTALKGTGITVSEFLTKLRHDTFMAARKHFGINNCWTTEGRIVLLLPDQKRHRIESMSELRPLLAKYPAVKATGSAHMTKKRPKVQEPPAMPASARPKRVIPTKK